MEKWNYTSVGWSASLRQQLKPFGNIHQRPLDRELERIVICYVVNFLKHMLSPGTRCSVVVKVLCYKPEGRGFEIRRGE
jgi:hypothetical protein